MSVKYCFILEIYQISAPAPAGPAVYGKSGQIRLRSYFWPDLDRCQTTIFGPFRVV